MTRWGESGSLASLPSRLFLTNGLCYHPDPVSNYSNLNPCTGLGALIPQPFFNFDSLALDPARSVPGRDDLLNVRLFEFKTSECG